MRNIFEITQSFNSFVIKNLQYHILPYCKVLLCGEATALWYHNYSKSGKESSVQFLSDFSTSMYLTKQFLTKQFQWFRLNARLYLFLTISFEALTTKFQESYFYFMI
eukprot:TRINITY_DN4948_c0_g1_i2.p6 TRINITY_DN4948_c0_g1~~TRINITY_DN4948_c0_g1_i2.p6  ORF type:complete len:107 (-),score=0.35 TRINITY_DN4948_c0_g1_i2:977-1297(-)